MKAVEIVYRYAAGDAPLRERPVDPEAARQRLNDGSRAFAALLDKLEEGAAARRVIHVDPHDLGLLRDDEGAPHQRPYAAILGCADARVPVELIFSEGPNDLFVVRVAGNVLGNEVAGSLRYAVDHLGESLKLIAVLGHSGCGAVSAAVDIFLDPAGYIGLASQPMLRSVLDRLLVVVHASAQALAARLGPEVARRPGYRSVLVEVSALSNAALTAYAVQQQLRASEAVRAAYGIYVLGSRQVWAPRVGSDEVVGLAEPPADPAGFIALGDAVIRSERIATMLG